MNKDTRTFIEQSDLRTVLLAMMGLPMTAGMIITAGNMQRVKAAVRLTNRWGAFFCGSFAFVLICTALLIVRFFCGMLPDCLLSVQPAADICIAVLTRHFVFKTAPYITGSRKKVGEVLKSVRDWRGSAAAVVYGGTVPNVCEEWSDSGTPQSPTAVLLSAKQPERP